MQRHANKYFPAGIRALYLDCLLAGGVGKADHKVPVTIRYLKSSIYGCNFNLLCGHSSLLRHPDLSLINQTLFISGQGLCGLTLGKRSQEQGKNQNY